MMRCSGNKSVEPTAEVENVVNNARSLARTRRHDHTRTQGSDKITVTYKRWTFVTWTSLQFLFRSPTQL